jgi:hypothetical protein
MKKLNFAGAFKYLFTLGKKAQWGHFWGILLGQEGSWPYVGEPGTEDPPSPVEPPPDPIPVPVDPPEVPQPMNELQWDEAWFCFPAESKRYGGDITEEQRVKMNKWFSQVRVCNWGNRRNSEQPFAKVVAGMVEQATNSPGRPIHLGLDWFEATENYPDGQTDPLIWGRMMLNAMRPFWNRVRVVELCDEPDNPKLLQKALNAYHGLLTEMGLEERPVSVTICTNPAKFAGYTKGLDIMAIEAYSKDIKGDIYRSDGDLVRKIREDLDTTVKAVEALKLRPAIVLQGYARNYSDYWGDPVWGLFNQRTFAIQLQEGCKWVLENRARLAYVAIFSAGRPSGSCSRGVKRPDNAAFDVWAISELIYAAFSDGLKGRTISWPSLPMSPIPGPAVTLIQNHPTRYKGQAGDAAGLSAPMRWGIITIMLLPVDAVGRRYLGVWADRRKPFILSWKVLASDGSFASLNYQTGEHTESAQWSFPKSREGRSYVQFIMLRSPGASDYVFDLRESRDAPPVGTSFDVVVSGWWGSNLLKWSTHIPPIEAAHEIAHGACIKGKLQICSAACNANPDRPRDWGQRRRPLWVQDQGRDRGLGYCVDAPNQPDR